MPIGSIYILAAILLLCAPFSQAIAGQDSGEKSIPEPTYLSVTSAGESVNIVVLKSINAIESDDSVAEIDVVELITSDSQRHTGVRLLFKNTDQLDRIYLDQGQTLQLRDEFVGLIMWYQRIQPCDARRCIHGVARCRPSQTIRQALCPGFYSTSEGEQGILLSTSRYSFYFPSLAPSTIIDVLNAAVAEFEEQ